MNCSNKKCLFNSEDGCRLEFCFFDDTEWKLEKETVNVSCILCNKIFTIDAKDFRDICPTCINKLKKLVNEK